MFGWRRKTDGFEWREYVRTTIKLKREERARKIDDIKNMAAAGAKQGGRKGISAGRNGVMWLWRLLQRIGAALKGMMTGRVQLPTLRLSSRTLIGVMFAGLGLLAAIAAYLQSQKLGADWSTLLTALVAVTLLGLAVAPLLARSFWDACRAVRRWPDWLSRVAKSGGRGRRVLTTQPSLRSVGVLLTVFVAAGSGFWLWQGRGLPTVTTWVPSFGSVIGSPSVDDIKGRGRAVSGDTIRIGRRMIKLAGIEAPEIAQVCRDRRKRRWRCGQRALAALRRIVRRRQLVCSDVVQISARRFKGTCKAGQTDIAGEVVAKGYAFAKGVIFQAYASAEGKARDAKRGIWQGSAQRPADFRAERWEVARKAAPDGCPIKGRVVRNAKVYVLPWALDYRQVRVSRRRGGRWFCSEDEAAEAGFKPSSTG